MRAARCPWVGVAGLVLAAANPALAQPGASAPADDGSGSGLQQDRAADGSVTPTPVSSDERDGKGAAQVAIPPGGQRELPDYDGRPEPRAPARELGLGLLRVLTFPLYAVSEYVLRRLLGLLVSTAEKHRWPTILVNFFTFGPERKAGIVPTTLVDFRLRPSVGLLFFWNDFLVPDNDLRLRAAFGGRGWYLVGASDQLEVAPQQSIGVRGWYTKRPDHIFHGVGPESGRRRARYSSQQLDAEFEYFARLWRTSSIESYVGVRDASFDPDRRCCEDTSVGAEVARGRYELPAGMEDGYTLARAGVQAALDTRPRRKLEQPRPGSDFMAPPGSGIRLAARAGQGGGLRPIPDARAEERAYYTFLTYGVTLGGYLDLTGTQRVLGVELIADLADPLAADGKIPFDELVSLGGARPMRGFLPGRLRGRSAAVARFEYRWPIWIYVDGTFQYDLGNVFSARFEDFEPELLRQSAALGVRMNNVRDHAFEVLVGCGTEPLKDGSRIEGIRLLFGASSGF